MRFLYRLILLGCAAVIVKVSAPILELNLTWSQALVITILTQLFGFIAASDRVVEVALLPV